MAKHASTDIRNIVLCGHAGSGKTMLAEAMLFKAGAISRLGQISDGSTVSDYDSDEKERQYSINSSVMHCEYKKKLLNIVDTPGGTDFVGGLISGIAAADLAVICINASQGIELMARKAWDYAGSMGLARMIVVSRMDSDNVSYKEVLANIKDVFGPKCSPFFIVDGEGPSFAGVTRAMEDGATGEGVDELKMEITENAVECDDALMEKYLESGDVTPDEVARVMQKAISTGAIVPVFAVSAEKDLGVEELMKGICEFGPSPIGATRKLVKGEEEVEYTATEDGPLAGQVFKVVSDPHVGKISYIRIFSGALASKDNVNLSNTGKAEKVAQLLSSQGDKREDLADAVAGDIVAITKMENLHVGVTISAKGFEGAFAALPFPQPMTGLAVSPKSRGDEQKLGTNMHRLCEEDPTFLFVRDDLTKEQVVRGIGQLHMDVMLHRLKTRFGMEVNTKAPKIPYLETITKQAEGSYRHKKQSGGSGQFGEVHLRIKPNERGGGFEFVNSIVGGVISGPFIPSVEKGVSKALKSGPVAGYPLVDVVVELFFGKEHPVDSKDIAFQIAGELGFREIVKDCKPALLEPVVSMEIVFPGQYFGDVSGDISTRRGRPTGTDQLGDMQVLKAEVPLAEVADYGGVIGGITQGEGFYNMELSHYEVVPSNIAQQVAAKAKAAQEED